MVHTFQGEFVELNRYFNGERDPGYYIYAGLPGSWNEASLRASIDWAMEGFRLIKAINRSSLMTKIKADKLPDGEYECHWVGDTYECFCGIGGVVIIGNNKSGEGSNSGSGPGGGPGGTSGGGGNGSSGSGGSGSGDGFNPPLDHGRGNPIVDGTGELGGPIDKIFKNGNLNPLHTRQINTALKSLESRCMSKGVVRLMSTSGITIEYGKMSDPNNLAAFQGVGKGGVVYMNPTAFDAPGDDLSNALLHELFHAYNHINYFGGGVNIGLNTYELVAEFMAYTFVNLHYGYSMKGTDHVIPPTDNRPWMIDYLSDISEATNQYRKKITKSQLNTLFSKYRNDFSDYIKHQPTAKDVTDVTPLVTLLNTVLNNNDCMYLD